MLLVFFFRYFGETYNLLSLQILSPGRCCLLLYFLFWGLQVSQFSLLGKKGHFSSYFPFFLHLFIDGQPRDSKSGLIDTSLFTKDSPEEWSQAHPEWRHSQRCVWGPCQQVHPAPPGSCSWGQSQQVQVSRTDSREGSRDELSFHCTEWAQRGNRKSIHMTETWRKMNDPLYNLKNSAQEE